MARSGLSSSIDSGVAGLSGSNHQKSRIRRFSPRRDPLEQPAQPPAITSRSNLVDLHERVGGGHGFLLNAERAQTSQDVTAVKQYKDAATCHDRHTYERAC